MKSPESRSLHGTIESFIVRRKAYWVKILTMSHAERGSCEIGSLIIAAANGNQIAPCEVRSGNRVE